MNAARVAALAALAIASLTGCGVSDDRTEARAAVERFYAALQQDDGARACGELAPDLIAQLESQSGRSCDSVVTRLSYDPGPVVSSDVYATNAIVELGSGETAFLSRASSGWRLSAIGCEAQAGKPRERPFDCEAEA